MEVIKMTNNYLVLRNTQFRGPRSPFSGLSGGALARTFGFTGFPEPGISTETLDKNQLMNLGKDPEIVGVAPIMPVKLIAPLEANESSLEENQITWGVEVTGAANSPYTGKGITVAVLDTGIDAGHEAFNGIELIQKDFTGEGNGDTDGHGTHCTGTICGRPKNGFRYSVAPGVQRALIGKIFNKDGAGETTWIYEAILWAIKEGAHVISMSLGFDFPGMVTELVDIKRYPTDFATSLALEAYRANLSLFDKLADLVKACAPFGQGSILVAAAGNEAKRQIHPDYEITVSPPAAAEGIISVGAVEKNSQSPQKLKVANFSNTGAIVCAPGVDIKSAKAGGGYISMTGTSMATPHAAGIAALWAEKLLETSGFVNPEILYSKLIGQASKQQFENNVDHADIGAGLVRSPLE
jgi:subtilisin family serine protease